MGHYASHAWNTICLTRGTLCLPRVGLYRDNQDCQDTQDCQDHQDIAVLEVLEVLVVLASPPSHEIFSGPLAPASQLPPTAEMPAPAHVPRPDNLMPCSFST